MQNYYGYGIQSDMRIDRVANIDEARQYRLYPNSMIYLIDQNEPYIYLKMADSQGKCVIRAFSLTEVDANKISDSKYITRDDFEAFRRDIMSALKGEKNESTSK